MKSNEFKQLCRTLVSQQEKCVDAFPWEDADAYTQWVAQTYYYVRHSTRLLALAAARYGYEEDAHHLRCIDHLKEERNHDKLALADLAAMKVSIADCVEFPETKAFYQSQYYLIEYVSPKALLGYILCLEALAATKGADLCRRLEKAHGPRSATFLKVHGEDDVDHLEKLYDQIGQLGEKDLDAVAGSLEQSCAIYAATLNRCATYAHRMLRKAA